MLPDLPPANLPERSGSHAGIVYRIKGTGPPLVLLPFFLAPSQWEPAREALARLFTVITLGGRHLGGVAALEDRATAVSYRGMVRTLWDVMGVTTGASILDVGCGSGALDRKLATQLGPGASITATDVNHFLLREAEAIATEEGLGDRITFRFANAERLPFADATFDHAFTVTVLEECDADRALAELFRVLRPGGRAGVIVRSIDLPQWWNLDLPPQIATKVDVPPQSVGSTGVADASLYPRMQHAGFTGLRCFPSLVTLDRPDGPIWRYREDHATSLLSPEELDLWHALTAQARAKSMMFQSHPMHCAVGIKPVS
jgi:ubiquinone/menaquinone biosynthesis C-methylase UbiE